MHSLRSIDSHFKKAASAKKAALLSRFFKTGKGEYAEGDKFLGLMVPATRIIAKKHSELSLKDVIRLLRSPWHEQRLCALMILLERFRKEDTAGKKRIYDLYLANTRFINNWDLVDLSCHGIVGEWLADKSRRPLYRLARSRMLWERRIAIVSCFAFLRRGEAKDTLAIAELLLKDEHDLIHKAVGWLLRETGKQCSEKDLTCFLRDNYDHLPRTTLRYAIERFPPLRRKAMLAGRF